MIVMKNYPPNNRNARFRNASAWIAVASVATTIIFAPLAASAKGGTGKKVAQQIAALKRSVAALQTQITTLQQSVPQVQTFTYDLAPGAIGTVITLPTDTPVFLQGTCSTIFDRGVSHVSILRTGTAPLFLEWVGLSSPAGSAIVATFSSTPGSVITFLDFAHQVILEVNDATSVRVHNTSGGQLAGVVQLIF
jgi:hypothetical protein